MIQIILLRVIMMKIKKRLQKPLVWAIALSIIIFAVIYVLFFNVQRTFHITETYRISLANGSETYLNVFLPVSGGYQTVSEYLVTGVDNYTIENNNEWSELTAAVPANNSEVIITISYSVILKRNAQPWDGEVLDMFTAPQQYVDSDNEKIIAIAEQLRGNCDYETARNILRYTHKTIRSPSRNSNRVNTAQLSASELLENPVGVCGDYAILMTALLRAGGIPARMISGLTLEVYRLRKAADWSHRGTSHAWVEFFADGKWHFADPTWGKFEKSLPSHLSYGTYEMNMDSDFQKERLEVIEGAGFNVVGGMSAPLMFTVYSTDDNASVTPRADVSFSMFR